MTRPWLRPATAALVFAGGVAGTFTRAVLGMSYPTLDGGFPWTTFSINISGSVLLAVVTGMVPFIVNSRAAAVLAVATAIACCTVALLGIVVGRALA